MFEAEVGKAIAKLRGSRTRRAVARQGKIASSAWSRHEGGEKQLRRETVKKILKGLGCTKEQLEEETFWQIAARFAPGLERRPALAAEASSRSGEGVDPSTRPLHEHAQAVAHHVTLFSDLLLERLAARLGKALPPDSSGSDSSDSGGQEGGPPG
jgi:hypothetical protein